MRYLAHKCSVLLGKLTHVCLIVGAEGAGGGEKLFAHSVTFSSVCHMPGTVLEAPDPEDLRRWACALPATQTVSPEDKEEHSGHLFNLGACGTSRCRLQS